MARMMKEPVYHGIESGERSWDKDGRILNAQDAAECVQSYQQAYTRNRFRWLMQAAASRGRGEAIDKVFRDAIPMP